MDIKQENIDELNALLKVKVTPDDYQEQVDKTLKKHQRSSRMPGFRPGKVPKGMIRKLYGKAVLAEELQKIVNNGLNEYINKNELEILGNPLPRDENDLNINWDEPGEFEFLYEMGLAPAFKIEIPPPNVFTNYIIKVDDERRKAYKDDLQRRFGNRSNPETVTEDCLIYCNIKELAEDGTEKEGGISQKAPISLEKVSNEEVRKMFIGKAKGDKVQADPRKLSENDADLASMLHLKKEDLDGIGSAFSFEIETISKLEKAAIDKDLFDKVFGEGKVDSETAFNEAIDKELQNLFKTETDRKLKHDIEKYLLENLEIKLPDDFLKRWMVAVSEKPISGEELEKEYPRYSKSIRYQLIQNKIIKDKTLKISDEEIIEFARHLIRTQYAQYGYYDIPDESMDDLVKHFTEDRQKVREIVETLSERKVFDYLRENVKKKDKEVSYDGFLEILRS